LLLVNQEISRVEETLFRPGELTESVSVQEKQFGKISGAFKPDFPAGIECATRAVKRSRACS
jgi:hypothetical protein